DAQNYALNGTASSGSVTSDNLQTVTYSGFANGPNVDDVAPAVVDQAFNYDVPTQDLSFTFNKDVSTFSTLLYNGYLELTNVDSGEVVPSYQVTWDGTTNTAHYTFPGYSNGILPDGNYRARIVAGL